MTERVLTDHGRLLEGARREMGISAREAARRAGISEGRWRQIVLGVQARAGGSTPVTAPARTLIAMALAVFFNPREVVRAAGLSLSDEAISGIAEELQREPRPAVVEAPDDQGALADEIERIRRLRGISPEDRIRMIKALVDLYEEQQAAQPA